MNLRKIPKRSPRKENLRAIDLHKHLLSKSLVVTYRLKERKNVRRKRKKMMNQVMKVMKTKMMKGQKLIIIKTKMRIKALKIKMMNLKLESQKMMIKKKRQ